MRGFTLAQQHVGWLRIVLVSFATVILMLVGFFVVLVLLPHGPPASPARSYGWVTSYGRILVAFGITAAAGFLFCWGLMLGFTTRRQALRWLSVYYGTLGAIVSVTFVSALVLFSDSSAPAWQLILAVLIAILAAFLLCWGLARLLGSVIGRFGNNRSPQ